MDNHGGYDDYPFVAEFYDHIVPYGLRKDVSFYVEMAKETGGPVLEVGCGTGRILIPTARAGIEIVGLDHSVSMLTICREKLSHEPDGVRSKVQLVQGDMRQFELGREFRLATLPFRSFQHILTVEDQLRTLQTIHRHLVPGGKVILDVFNPSLERLVDEKFLSETDEEPEFTMPDGRKVVRRSRAVSRDPANQVHDIELIYYVTHPDGREERLVHRFQMRYLFRFEGEHLLARAGFKVENVYADYDKSPFGSKYPGELIFIAGKQ